MFLLAKINLLSYLLTSQFYYCGLVWMCHNRANNNKIYHLHEKFLCILCNGNKSLFQGLIDKDKGFKVHVRNVRALAIEMFKVSNNYSKSLMSEIFDKGNNVYDFRDFVISFPCLNIICINYCNLKFIFLVHTFYLYFS